LCARDTLDRARRPRDAANARRGARAIDRASIVRARAPAALGRAIERDARTNDRRGRERTRATRTNARDANDDERTDGDADATRTRRRRSVAREMVDSKVRRRRRRERVISISGARANGFLNRAANRTREGGIAGARLTKTRRTRDRMRCG